MLNRCKIKFGWEKQNRLQTLHIPLHSIFNWIECDIWTVCVQERLRISPCSRWPNAQVPNQDYLIHRGRESEYSKTHGNFCMTNRCVLQVKDLESQVIALYLLSKRKKLKRPLKLTSQPFSLAIASGRQWDQSSGGSFSVNFQTLVVAVCDG